LVPEEDFFWERESEEFVDTKKLTKLLVKFEKLAVVAT
jgi:hypothetical protein